jgi:hypothetical protein
MKKLENLKWVPRWVSHLGCIKGCLDYLELDVSDAWLYGATGHAFIINMHQEVCPSGPTAWQTMQLSDLGKNVGYVIDGVVGFKTEDGFSDVQKRAWQHVKDAIDRGWPCYGWELEMAEFYVINGYDDVGYYYAGPGCDEGKGPKPWQALGDTEIGVVEMYSLRPGQAATDTATVKEAFSFVLEHATNPQKWIFPGYKAGPQGFEVWIRALQDGKAADFGMRYNAAVWAECRQHAVAFLQEAHERVNGRTRPLFEQAIGHYQVVSQRLEQLSEAYPFSPAATMAPVPVDDRCLSAVAALKDARAAEAAGLETLARIASKLDAS